LNHASIQHLINHHVSAVLTEGGAVPALRGWAELSAMFVQEMWRGRGIGTWLVQHAVAWLRVAGCDRIVLSCAAEDEAAGAGRFYRRFGWEVFTRLQDGWHYPKAER
jgi:GNAT superfamily N-acetyltransferase